MTARMLRSMLCPLLAAAAMAAQAGVGVRTLPAADAQHGPITLWYPSAAADTHRSLGAFELDGAWDAAPQRGNGRLVVLSHGSAGSPWPQHDLARALVQAGFIVASPEHQGDNWHDDSLTGPRAWIQRPREISGTIDRLAADAAFGPLFDAQHVGVYGMSAGGLTALVMAGAQWQGSRMAEHCSAHAAEDPGFCRYGQRQVLPQAALAALQALPVQQHADARVQAVVAAVPVGVVVLAPSLAQPKAAVGLVEAQQDRVLAPAFHVRAVQAACARCETLAALPGAGHDAVLSPWPAAVSARAGLSGAEAAGFDRTAQLPALYRTIARFFQQHL
jgi:predicted dienelactone hydrolase